MQVVVVLVVLFYHFFIHRKGGPSNRRANLNVLPQGILWTFQKTTSHFLQVGAGMSFARAFWGPQVASQGTPGAPMCVGSASLA